MAAAMMPLAGLIGGGVDMSRLYLTKTRLQQACDAGALAGRKAMAAGVWTTGTGNGSTNDKSETMFGANFASGQYGTSGLTKAFSESNGIVTGTASVTVPMTIMKVFGMRSRTTSVSCTAKMELPNTDVMFVLDVTYSMGCAPSATSDSCSQASAGSQRIDGLKKAVKCFYEALEKVGTPEPCTYNASAGTYSSTGDPTATTANTTAQVRIGFVPYGVNVNVGKVLPNSMMADNWTYQSRTANTQNVWGYTLGAESPAPSGISNWGSWSSAPSGTTLSSQANYTGWGDISNSPTTITINGTTYTKRPSGYNSTTCPNLNTIGPSGNKMLTYTDTGSVQNPVLQSTSNNPPTYNASSPPTSQTLSYNQTDNHTVVGYKYVWNTSSGGSCRLQQGSYPSSGASPSYQLTRSGGTTSKAITWTQYTGVFRDWTYKPVSYDVSSLKAGGSTWNNSISLPNIQVTNGSSVTLSGSSSSTTLQYPTSATVPWDGCIEEAQTFQNTDGNPSDDWTTLPTSAWDMNVNLVPNNPSTPPTYNASTLVFSPGSYWGPMLANTGSTNSTVYGAVWARYSGSNTNWTTASVTTATALDQDNYKYICTASAARKLTEYKTNTDFLTYVNALSATDLGTYHDIGMLWGARLISPLGVFASENAAASTGGAIQRHLIFMTDGNTRTVSDTTHSQSNNYLAYGLNYYNRFQFSSDIVGTTADDLVNARLIALCNQVKNMNIQLWVVSYGSAVNTTTQSRLQSCATDTSHFFSATDTPTLIANFQQIAAKISQLRLTS